MNTLSNGSELDQETFNDFVSRLKNDCIGQGANEHHTAEAIFIVQNRVRIYGLNEEYAEGKIIVSTDREGEFKSPDELYKFHHESLEEGTEIIFDNGFSFLELCETEKWEIIENLEGFEIIYYIDRWEYVTAHFTKSAAEAFIKRKKHDYTELRIYVDAQIHCWEFNAIKNGLINGTIVLKN